MNRKFMAMLLVIVMVVGMVPVTAMAEEHEHDYYDHVVSDNAGKHYYVCSCNAEPDGGSYRISCTDGNVNDGLCDSCGYRLYEDPTTKPGTHEHNYVTHTNNNGTHTLSCTCGGSVTMNCTDGNVNDGLCDSCGYRLYEDPTTKPGTHEHKYVAHTNNNGTHNTSCTCGLGEQNIACVDADKNFACDDCGYMLPTYSADSTAGLDNVPKTGCAFVEWLYALIFS